MSDIFKQNPGKVVTRYQFSEIFAKAWAKGMTMKNIIGGLEASKLLEFFQ